LERDDDIRWPAIHHYYMTSDHKEHAKRVLGFQSVPFYVFVRGDGTILRKGGPSSAFPNHETMSRLFELHEHNSCDEQSNEPSWNKDNHFDQKIDSDFLVSESELEEAKTETWGEGQDFVIDDLDF
jgi:hypothetical protein